MIGEEMERNPVEVLAEQFLERYRKGERPALSEYTSQYPHLAAEIRDLFPALVMIEGAGPGHPDAPARRTGRVTPDGLTPQQLGDYRILREVGRGGMGVVYEAVQLSLNRHVALKVLPFEAAANPTSLQRFRREARSAARLHHTNIVPVFDVGEHLGVPYYAMQFIQGESLEEVFIDLRRLRGGEGALGGQRAAPAGEDPRPPHNLTVRLAGGLLTGQFQVCATEATTDLALEPAAGEASGPPAAAGSRSDLHTQSDGRYYRSVARLGQQVAEALSYAHSHKVLHRDIKPSNLLLDLQGVVWVTDFGLAKEESDDLTRTGDVVGTLRYMAPERFNGVSDPRSDVYSLGLTLYELLTLRPAFDESDRGQLIRRITLEERLLPRQVDPCVPRDLETVVLKAIAREPGRRYQTAEALAEDLSRYLADRPIQARRTSWREHAWRWVRRNPGWAATLALALGVLLIAAVGGTVLSLHLHQALLDAQRAEDDKTEKLWQSYLDQSRAERRSGRVGQRFKALEAIRAAAKIRVAPQLRDEATAALVLPDVEVAREWDGFPDGTMELAFDADFERCARLTKEGAITVCRLNAAGEEILARLPAHGSPPYAGPVMSPDGQFVVYRHAGHSGKCKVRVWRLNPAPEVVLEEPSGFFLYALAFSPDSRRLAVGDADGSVHLYELPAGRRVRHLKPGGSPEMHLAFHPHDGVLAVANGNAVRLFDVNTGRVLSVLRHPAGVHYAAWHPGGRRLATGGNDRQIYHWDTATATQAMAPWTGQTAEGIVISFNHTGGRMVSSDWSGPPRLRDANGRVLLQLPDGLWRFSRTGSLLGWQRSGTKVRLYRLAEGREMQVLRRRNAPDLERIYNAAVDPDGRLLAVGSDHQLTIFDLERGEELASSRLPDENHPLRFDPEGGLLTGGNSGLLVWPVQTEAGPEKALRIGPPWRRPAVLPSFCEGAGASLDGKVLAVPQSTCALVFHRDRPGEPLRLGPQYDVRCSPVSPDGRWVATCSHWWDGRSRSVRIWDTRTSQRVHDLPLEGSTRAAFSGDGRWLATNTWRAGCRLWEVGSWREARRFKDAYFAFSPDGRLLALNEDASGVIRLVESVSGREVGRLIGPDATTYPPVCFTPDGTRLVTSSFGFTALYVWDLRLIRQGLKELGLDWDWDEFTSPVRGSGARQKRDNVYPSFSKVVIDNDGVVPSSPEPLLKRILTEATAAVAAAPASASAHFRRALAGAMLGQWQQACDDAGHALRLQPDHVAVYYLRSQALHRLGRHREATQDLLEAMRREPGPVPSLTEVQRALGLPPLPANRHNALAWDYLTGGGHIRFSGLALLLSEKALLLEPASAASMTTRGVACYRIGHWEQAIDALRQSISLQTGHATAVHLYPLAMCYHRLGRKDRARECFDQAEAWCKNQKRLPEAHKVELAAFRAEAVAVLQGPSEGR